MQMYLQQEALLSLPLCSGMSIGNYCIRCRLAQGAVADIYLGYNISTQQLVAIKVFELNEIVLPYQQEQFSREISFMRQSQHESIVPLLDAGQEGSLRYLVMPYLSGGTLQDLLAKGPLDVEGAATILDQLADALHHIHERGLLHRDIKPSNILFDEIGHVYLADFSIASRAGEDAVIDDRIMGSPMYMAPELCEGYASESSDIYALGIVLYEMLTGLVPFDGDSALAICRKQLYDLPMPPSILNSTLSLTVEQVVLAALEKEPTLRFHTARHLAHAYQQALLTPSLMERTHIRLSNLLTGLKAGKIVV